MRGDKKKKRGKINVRLREKGGWEGETADKTCYGRGETRGSDGESYFPFSSASHEYGPFIRASKLTGSAAATSKRAMNINTSIHTERANTKMLSVSAANLKLRHVCTACVGLR